MCLLCENSFILSNGKEGFNFIKKKKRLIFPVSSFPFAELPPDIFEIQFSKSLKINYFKAQGELNTLDLLMRNNRKFLLKLNEIGDEFMFPWAVDW